MTSHFMNLIYESLFWFCSYVYVIFWCLIAYGENNDSSNTKKNSNDKNDRHICLSFKLSWPQSDELY